MFFIDFGKISKKVFTFRNGDDIIELWKKIIFDFHIFSYILSHKGEHYELFRTRKTH